MKETNLYSGEGLCVHERVSILRHTCAKLLGETWVGINGHVVELNGSHQSHT